MSSSSKPRLVPCPTCRGDAVYAASNPWRPFCSERCRSVDLGAWASESFRVPAVSPPDSAGLPDEAPPPESRH